VGGDVHTHGPIPRNPDVTLEVLGHSLTEEKKRAFAEEAPAILADLAPIKPWSRIARMFGIKANQPQPVALQFHELSTAISDAFLVCSDRLAA
jgi:hypothetical protein